MNEDWKQFANCKGEDINKFFDAYEESSAIQLEVDTMCANCVVRTQCLDWAIEEGLEGGVFGRRYLTPTPKGRAKRKKERA